MPTIVNRFCNDTVNHTSLEILVSGYQRAGTEWNKARSFSPHYSKLYFILGGDAYITYNQKVHPLLPGRVYLIPTDLIYDNGCETSIDFMYFNIRLINSSGYDYLANYPEMLEMECPCAETQELIAKYRSHELTDALTVKERLMNTVLRLMATAPGGELTARKYSPCVTGALRYIHENLSIQLSVDELCRAVYAARSTLNKKFAAEVGMSIGTYIDREIMMRCEQLLTDGELSIRQISDKFGFCDQFYFSRRFKSRFGITPQQYRQLRGL